MFIKYVYKNINIIWPKMGKLNIFSRNIRSDCGNNVENAGIMFVWLNSFEE